MQTTLYPDLWIQNYADYLYSYACFRIEDRMVCEDLVQDTFLSAWKSAEQFKGNASEKTWLTTILKNKIIDHYRKESRIHEVLTQSIDYSYFFEEESDHWRESSAPDSDALSAMDKLQLTEMRRIIERCFELLPSLWSTICKMKLIDEEKTEIICKTFHITTSNFWVIMHRGKLQLRDCIDKKLNPSETPIQPNKKIKQP